MNDEDLVMLYRNARRAAKVYRAELSKLPYDTEVATMMRHSDYDLFTLYRLGEKHESA